MILENHIRGRRRVLDPAKKARLCELVAQENYSVEQAAESLDVSLRTVQRERKYDQDFDHEVRLALQSTPDPLKLMEHAARTHWRAAAWLLERTKPEEFARKPVNMTSVKLVSTAFRYLQEAALETVPEEYHEALYRRTQAAIEQAFACCFPLRGPWGEPKIKKLPFATPLADVQWRQASREREGVLHDRTPAVDPRFDDRQDLYVDVEVATDLGPIEVSLPPEDYRHMQGAIAAAQARAGILSPKTSETTEFNAATQSAATKPSPADGHLEFVIATVERTIDDECPETWNDTEALDHPDAASDAKPAPPKRKPKPPASAPKPNAAAPHNPFPSFLRSAWERHPRRSASRDRPRPRARCAQLPQERQTVRSHAERGNEESEGSHDASASTNPARPIGGADGNAHGARKPKPAAFVHRRSRWLSYASHALGAIRCITKRKRRG